MKKITLLLAVILLLTGCTGTQNDISISEPPNATTSNPHETAIPQSPSLADKNAAVTDMLSPFADVRGGITTDAWTITLASDKYNPADMYTYQFNEHTVFTGNEELQQEIMERGKNPGLGVRALHERGITGQGVSVAIIDQELLLEPPEYADKIVEYYDCEFDFEPGQGSMHGSAVVSILAGESCGVAPDAKVYYAAAPSWNADAAYYANGLNWIIRKNEALPENEKIRVVSVQCGPSGIDSSFDKNQEMWDEAVDRAQAAGILVIDLRVGVDTGFLEHGFYDFNDPDNIEKARNGSAASRMTGQTIDGYISVPCDYRTTVEQYDTGDYYFRYAGEGGASWAPPYVAGVLALGWQINPQLTAVEIKQLLIESAYENEYGERIIYPAAFIKLVEATT